MNFIDALMTVELVIKSGAVPLLIGESGIGKTSLVKDLAKKYNYHSINIDGNLLKEGEIGGLPTVEDYITEVNGEKVSKKKTVYAVHNKLLEIDKVLMNEPNRKILLFIDEINRCEHSVQQELMNIILNREINGYILPDNVYIMAAMNPSNKYEEFSQSDYGVVDMDPAQENRFVWIEMDADAKTWIRWGMESIGKETRIHSDILEFIASFPEYLHKPYSNESVKATPRSWERVSDSYKVYISQKDTTPSRIFYNVVKGNVGVAIAQDFYNFLDSHKNPLIKPEDLFKEDSVSEELKNKINKESHSRLYLTAKNALLYLKDKENRSREINIFSEVLQLYPADLKMGIMQDIKNNYEDTLYKDFMENEVFVEGYFAVYSQLAN